MKQPVDLVPEAFLSTGPNSQTIPSALAQSMSDASHLCVEITFDMESRHLTDLIYIDLVNATGDRRAHFSIRTKKKSIVLNTMESGVWSKEISAGLNFAILRYWRLWLVVDRSGTFSVKLGTVTLCQFPGKFLPVEIRKISTNVSARCVLGLKNEPSGVCGLLDRSAPLGMTALVHAPEVQGKDPTGLKLSIGSDEIKIKSTSVQVIAGKEWLVCKLDETHIAKHPRSQSVHVTTPASAFDIFDVLALPVVEFSRADISLRSFGRLPPEGAIWRCKTTGLQTATRLAIRPAVGNVARDAGFTRFITPLSEILRLVPVGSQCTNATLSVSGIPETMYQLAVGTQIYPVIEAFIHDNLSSGLTVSAELRMIFLDWWSVLHQPEHQARFVQAAPLLGQLLKDHQHFAGAFQSDEAATPEPAGPPPELISLWRGLRSASLSFMDPTIGTEDILRQVQTLAGLLPPAARSYFVLEISAPLMDAGLSAIIDATMTDDFLTGLISPKSDGWSLSSALAPLAARRRFEEIGDIVERLSKMQDVALNYRSFSAAILAANAANLTTTGSLRISHGFLDFLKSLGSREHTSFRHAGLMKALIQMTLMADTQPDWHQANLLAFIELHYSTVPEFWTAFEIYAQNSLGGPFVDRLKNLAATSALGNTGLARFRAKGETAAPSSDAMHVVATGERLDYLSTFLRIHGLSGPVNWGSSAAAALCDDHFLRTYAHPFMDAARARLGDLPQHPVRDAIHRLQAFPRVEHHNVLESLGRAILSGDDAWIAKLVSNGIENGPTGDAATDAVIIDVITWFLLMRNRNENLLSAVVLQILDRIKTEADPLAVKPGLHAAVNRLQHAARANDLDALTLKQIADLEHLYLTRFPDAKAISKPAPSKAKAYFADTMVALVTCRKYLDTRARECRDTWVKDIEACGAAVLFFCGTDDIHGEARFDPETSTVYLPVGDSYEDLPEKSIAIFQWITINRPEFHVLKIDDDCYLDAQTFLGSLSYRRSHYFGRPLSALSTSFNRTWHQSKSTRDGNKRAIDTSPLGSRYADGGGGYVLSRVALRSLSRVVPTPVGLRLRMASFFEDKMIGDLLTESGIEVSDFGYTSLQARRTHEGALPVLQVDRTFYPSALSGIAVAHLDEPGLMPAIRDGRAAMKLQPPRLWPMNTKPSLQYDSNMLEYLNRSGSREKIDAAQHVCICVIRNEKTILPHFLQHYRSLGIEVFLMVDNLSDDGTREYLLAQDDVVLFGAASEYRASHYGVDWQRVLLDHFCPGRWVVVADADEFLLLPQNRPGALGPYCLGLELAGHDAAVVLMADMYPKGTLEEANFAVAAPSTTACAFDAKPVRRWFFNRGPFGNLASYVSSLRHRLLPLSPPERFTSQKIALFKFNPLMSFSEGFHFGTGMRFAPGPVAFLHYKYSADFAARARLESQRKQHFGGAVEYRAYLNLVDKGLTSLWRDGVSKTLDLTADGALADLLRGVESPADL